MRLIVRPIRYTARVPLMQEWASRLGMVPLVESPNWVVMAAGSGRLAFHHVADGDPLDRTTTLAVETDDLDALEQRWSELGMITRRTDRDALLLFGSTPLGGEIAAGRLSPTIADGAVADPSLTVMPMVVTTEVGAVAEWFSSWGPRQRISSDRGGWVDLEFPDSGGLVGIHHAGNLSDPAPRKPMGDMSEIGVALTFESSDVDALLERVQAAGLEDAHVIDEAYNRTLLVTCPDGEEIWVNGEQADMYGYTRAQR